MVGVFTSILEEELDELKELDQKIFLLWTKIFLNQCVTPLNIKEEFEIFTSKHWNYNPQLAYKYPEKDQIIRAKKELEAIKNFYSTSKKLKSWFMQLFFDKIDELLVKIDLIDAYRNQDEELIKQWNIKLFGDFDPELVKQSATILQNSQKSRWKELGRVLMLQEVEQWLKKWLESNWLSQVEISIHDHMAQRFLVVFWSEKIALRIASGVKITQIEFEAVIEHECETHIMRYLQGKNSWWKILQTGTSWYLSTEEGLAVMKATEAMRKHIPDYINQNIYYKYLLGNYSVSNSFSESFQFWQSLKKSSIVKIFNGVLRQKSWLQDTWKWSGIRREKVYLDGYDQIWERISKKWQIQDLFVGKIKIQDLSLLAMWKQ